MCPQSRLVVSCSNSYYDVLGVSRTADEATIRRAYKELALRHHPDKNPDRPEAASLQFQLVAEAYAVLKDPQKKMAYDNRGAIVPAPGAPARAHFGMTMTLDKATRLFREVFGEQFAHNLAGCVAPAATAAQQAFFAGVLPAFKATGSHLMQAAAAARHTTVAKEGVGYVLKWGTQDCAAAVASAEQQLAQCRYAIEQARQKLADHRQAVKAVMDRRQKESAERPWWQHVVDFVSGDREEREGREDEAAAKVTKKLRKILREAKEAEERCLREMLSAKEAQALALEEERQVQEGVSLTHVVKAGSYLLGGLLAMY